tara:strand:- start:864 stop:1724 length:861 start_codon:yes stop_codon:yes gene_type:complete
MRNAVVDYAIPRSKVAEAKARDLKYNSTEATTELVERAKRSFTDVAKTGEGGEMLLFLLAERFLKLPQILCKMDLKTDNRMHYHGSDGVYAGVTPSGTLKLYWGESKIYNKVGTAIRDCLASLAPFLTELESEDAEREQDLILLSDKADLTNPELTDALKRYFDRSSPMSARVQYCGVALVGFDPLFTQPRMRERLPTRSSLAPAKRLLPGVARLDHGLRQKSSAEWKFNSSVFRCHQRMDSVPLSSKPWGLRANEPRRTASMAPRGRDSRGPRCDNSHDGSHWNL